MGIATGTAAAPFYTLGVFMALLGAAFGVGSGLAPVLVGLLYGASTGTVWP